MMGHEMFSVVIDGPWNSVPACSQDVIKVLPKESKKRSDIESSWDCIRSNVNMKIDENFQLIKIL